MKLDLAQTVMNDTSVPQIGISAIILKYSGHMKNKVDLDNRYISSQENRENKQAKSKTSQFCEYVMLCYYET